MSETKLEKFKADMQMWGSSDVCPLDAIAAAEALAAKWERIALSLATYKMLLEKQGEQYRTFTVKADDKFGEWHDTPQAALLAWSDTQKGA